MDCRNCGAPMELFERRRYYFCPYCGTFHFIDTPPIEGIRILERGASPLPCPLCSAPLAKSLLDDAHVVEHCEQCRSGMDVHPYYGPGNVVIDSCSRCNLIWLDFGELKQITDAPGRDRGKKPELMDVFDFPDGFADPNDD